MADGVCIEHIIVLPPYANLCSNEMHCEHDRSSNPLKIILIKQFFYIKNFIDTYVVGSSRNITDGLFISSSAIDNLFFSPPDKLFPNV